MLDADELTFLAIPKPGIRDKSERTKHTLSVSGPVPACHCMIKSYRVNTRDSWTENIRHQDSHDTRNIRRRQKLVLLPHAIVGAIVKRLRHRAVSQGQERTRCPQTLTSELACDVNRWLDWPRWQRKTAALSTRAKTRGCRRPGSRGRLWAVNAQIRYNPHGGMRHGTSPVVNRALRQVRKLEQLCYIGRIFPPEHLSYKEPQNSLGGPLAEALISMYNPNVTNRPS